MRVHLRPATAAPNRSALRLALPLGQRQREAAVQRITGAERIDGANLKHRHPAHRIAVREKQCRSAHC